MSAISAAGTAKLKNIAAIFRNRTGLSLPPTADFTFAVSGLTATFTDASSDPDVKKDLTYAWDFGDAATSTAQNPSRTYAAAGTYNVQLTVTDHAGLTASTTKPVTV